MPLQKRTVPVLLGGLDAGGSDPKLVGQGLLKLENGQLTRNGAIEKRPGLRDMVGSYTDKHIATHNDRPLLFGNAVATHNGDTATAGGFTSTEPSGNTESGYRMGLFDTQTSTFAVPPEERKIACAEIMQKGEIVACVYTEDEHASNTAGTWNLILEIYNRYSNVLITRFTLADSLSYQVHARMVDPGGDNIFILYPYDSNGKWKITEIETITGQGSTTELTDASGMTAIVPNYGASDDGYSPAASSNSANFDACAVDDDDDSIIVTYASNRAAGNVDVNIVSIATKGGASYTGQHAITRAFDSMLPACFKYDTGEAAVVWAEDAAASDIRMVTVDTTPAVVEGGASGTSIDTAPSNHRCISLTGITTSAGAQCRVYYTLRNMVGTGGLYDPDLLDPIIRTSTVNTDSGIATDLDAETMLTRAYLSHKPFINSDDDIVFGVYYQDYNPEANTEGLNPTLFWVRDENTQTTAWDSGHHTIIGKTLEGKAAYNYVQEDGTATIGHAGDMGEGGGAFVSSVYATAVDVWMAASPQMTVNRGLETWMTLARVDMSIPANVTTKEINGLLSIPNSTPYFFDGRHVFEQGFLHRPDRCFAEVDSGGSLQVGTYSYRAVYEWYDAQGNRHLSPPSLTVSATTDSSNKTINVYIPACVFTHRGGVQVVIFRTESPTSSVFRRLTTSVSSPGPTLPWIILADDGTVGYQDASDDTVLRAQEQDYSSAGVLSDESPAGHHVSTVFKNRAFFVPRAYSKTDIQYSKPFIAGEAPEFNGFLTRTISPDGGEITALHPLHDKLIILKRHQIWATHGEGYDARGTGVNFTDPYLVSETIGCIDQRAVALIPEGIVFLSDFGLYLLGKDLQVRFIGGPVKYHTDNLTLTRASVVAKDNHVIFSTSDGVALVYNYQFKQWSTFTNHEASDATIANDGLLYFRRPQHDTVRCQSRSTFVDPYNRLIPLTIETGWYSMAQLFGYKRVYHMVFGGYNIDDHTLTVKTAYDFEPTWTDDQDYSSSGLGTNYDYSAYFGDDLGSTYQNTAYLVKVFGSRQKCTAIRFHISDEASTAAGENFSINAIAVVVGVKGGTRRLGSARTV